MSQHFLFWPLWLQWPFCSSVTCWPISSVLQPVSLYLCSLSFNKLLLFAVICGSLNWWSHLNGKCLFILPLLWLGRDSFYVAYCSKEYFLEDCKIIFLHNMFLVLKPFTSLCFLLPIHNRVKKTPNIYKYWGNSNYIAREKNQNHLR